MRHRLPCPPCLVRGIRHANPELKNAGPDETEFTRQSGQQCIWSRRVFARLKLLRQQERHRAGDAAPLVCRRLYEDDSTGGTPSRAAKNSQVMSVHENFLLFPLTGPRSPVLSNTLRGDGNRGVRPGSSGQLAGASPVRVRTKPPCSDHPAPGAI